MSTTSLRDSWRVSAMNIERPKGGAMSLEETTFRNM